MIIVASHNRGKIKEIKEILKTRGDQVLGLEDLGFDQDIVEDGSTLEENAEIKARAVAAWVEEKFPGQAVEVIADDTGLFVPALGGAPGLYSARYAGPGASDEANRAKLLKELAGQEDRAAYFETLVVHLQGGRARAYRGRLEGWIGQEEQGQGGFGYDSIFYLADGRSLAQLSDEEKNRISHRRRALDALVAAWDQR